MTNKKMKVAVKLHDGTQFETEVENFDAKSIASELNNDSNSLTAIGDVVVHRSNIARIVPVADNK